MTARGHRIGLFGGAFDPVHTGHVKVVQSFLDSNLIDILELLPTAHPPHKENESSASFRHRCKMLRLAFSGFDRVKVNEVEQNLPKPSFTLQTLKYLQDKNPDNIYFLCIGEDNLASFHKWHKYREILQRATLLVAARPGFEGRNQDDEILEKAVFVEHEEFEISSTNIRKTDMVNQLSDKIPDDVLRYIKEHNLYSF